MSVFKPFFLTCLIVCSIATKTQSVTTTKFPDWTTTTSLPDGENSTGKVQTTQFDEKSENQEIGTTAKLIMNDSSSKIETTTIDQDAFTTEESSKNRNDKDIHSNSTVNFTYTISSDKSTSEFAIEYTDTYTTSSPISTLKHSDSPNTSFPDITTSIPDESTTSNLIESTTFQNVTDTNNNSNSTTSLIIKTSVPTISTETTVSISSTDHLLSNTTDIENTFPAEEESSTTSHPEHIPTLIPKISETTSFNLHQSSTTQKGIELFSTPITFQEINLGTEPTNQLTPVINPTEMETSLPETSTDISQTSFDQSSTMTTESQPNHPKNDRKVKSLQNIGENETIPASEAIENTTVLISETSKELEISISSQTTSPILPRTENMNSTVEVETSTNSSIETELTKIPVISSTTLSPDDNSTTSNTSKPLVEPNDHDYKEDTNATDEITEFILQFEGDCNDTPHKEKCHNVNFFSQREVVSKELTCVRVVQLKFAYSDGFDLSDSESTFESLKHAIGKLEMSLEKDTAPLRLVQVFASTNVDIDDANGTNSTVDVHYLGGLSYSEFVSYVVIGCCFGCLILFAFILLCAKCCKSERKHSNLRDIPQITLRLEDYNLTRIPRPTTIYSTENSKCPVDNANGASGSKSDDGLKMSCAYDTGVVPLDEYDGDGRRYTNSSRYHQNGGGGELRTFRRAPVDRQQSLEMEHREGLSKNNSLSNSTERLTREYYARTRDPGLENPIYN